MIRLIIILFAFFPISLKAQSHDFLLLQKRQKTIATYYAGNHIAITTKRGAYIEATITQISHDSIFLKQDIVQPVPTSMGYYVSDTVGHYRYAFDLKDIKAIGRVGRKFDLSASSASLMGGGTLLTLGSIVVYLADRPKFSPSLLITSVALVGAGYALARFSGKGMVLGKKYKLIYVDMSSKRD